MLRFGKNAENLTPIHSSFFKKKTARGFTNVSFSWHHCKQSVVLQGQQFSAEQERFLEQTFNNF